VYLLSGDWKKGLAFPQSREAGCVCVPGTRFPRPASSNRLTELLKLGFLCLYLAETTFWRWSSLSPLAGRKVVCRLRVTCSVLSPVLEVTCVAVVRDGKGWVMLPDSTPRSRAASPGAEVSTAVKKAMRTGGPAGG